MSFNKTGKLNTPAPVHPHDSFKQNKLKTLMDTWNIFFGHSDDVQGRQQTWDSIQNVANNPHTLEELINTAEEIIKYAPENHSVGRILSILKQKQQTAAQAKPLNKPKLNPKARKAKAQELKDAGLADHEIASHLGVTEKTVKGYFKSKIKGIVSADGTHRRLNIPLPSRRTPPEEDPQIFKMY